MARRHLYLLLSFASALLAVAVLHLPTFHSNHLDFLALAALVSLAVVAFTPPGAVRSFLSRLIARSTEPVPSSI